MYASSEINKLNFKTLICLEDMMLNLPNKISLDKILKASGQIKQILIGHDKYFGFYENPLEKLENGVI